MYNILNTVSSKRSKVVVNIGTEMLERYRQNKQLPSLVEMSNRDDECTLRIKRIITHMTEFRSMNRKNIQEAEQEYKGIYFLTINTSHDPISDNDKENLICNAKN